MMIILNVVSYYVILYIFVCDIVFFFIECFKVLEIDVVFVLIVIIGDVDDIFQCMKDVVEIIIDIYGVYLVQYSFIVYGVIFNIVFDFKINFFRCENLKYFIE